MAAEQLTISGMPGRYATALFELANEAKALDDVADDLGRFQALVDGSDDLGRLVKSPVFSAEEQSGAIAAVLTAAKITGLAAKFVSLVAANRRLFAIRAMIKGFVALVAHSRGEVTADVTSAEALAAPQKKALAAELKKALGKDANIVEKVDPEILGGLIVKVGSRMIDSSLKSKLNSLNIAMKEVG